MTDQIAHIQSIPQPTTSGIARALILLVALFALLMMVYVGHASQTTLTGQRAYDLQVQLDRLNHKNAQLEYEIASLTTPSEIARRAARANLHPATPSQIRYMGSGYAAATPTPVVRFVEPAPAQPTSDSFDLALLWYELLARLGLAPNARAVEATTSP